MTGDRDERVRDALHDYHKAVRALAAARRGVNQALDAWSDHEPRTFTFWTALTVITKPID